MKHKYFCPSGTVAKNGGPMIKYHRSSFDGSRQPFAVYVPTGYNPRKKWPLVISLHGYSSDHVLNLRRVFGLGNAEGQPDTECKQIFPEFPEIEYLVASPYAFGSVGYAAQGETDALDVLSVMKSKYNIDEDRIYLTGLSMGGEGTWHLAVRYPDIWAAIAPVCASMGFMSGPEDIRTFAGNLNNMPVHISHGSADSVVTVENSRSMDNLMTELRYAYEYVEYPDVDHNAWDFTYADAAIFKWFSKFKRNPKPSKVVFTADRLRYNKSYWVEINRISAWNTLSHIEAEVSSDNTILVYSVNIDAFTLHLDKSPIDISKPVRVFCNDSEIFNSIPEDHRLMICLAPESSADMIKIHGLEGPPFDALKTKHAVVYGTGIDDQEFREMLRCTGLSSVFWTDWQDLETPVFADNEVTDDIIRDYNLLLIGNSETNSIIAKINDDMPIRFFKDGVAIGDEMIKGDLGFIEVYPNPMNTDKYAVILGGNNEDMLVKAIANYRNMPDYGVFSANTDFLDPETFIAYGYFNLNWGL